MTQLSKGKPLLVCGSVHVSVLATVTDQKDEKNKNGRIVFDIGGVANDIASAAREAGTSVRLLTALADRSPYTKIIVEHLNLLGIEKAVRYEKGLTDPAVCAIVDENGKISSSVSSTAIDSVFFPAEFIHSALFGASGCAIDTSLSDLAIRTIAQKANEMHIPVFICASSVSGFAKIKMANASFAAIFTNKVTIDSLLKGDLGSSVYHIASSADSLSRLFGCPLIISKEDEGVSVARPDGGIEENFSAININVDGKDYHGADSALSAYTLVHLLYSRRSLKDSLKIAVQAVEERAQDRYLKISAGGGGLSQALNGINKEASLDHLTKLPNRSAAVRKINKLIESGSKFFVAMVDVDHFKRVNDQFGHNVGDEALVLISAALSKAMRDHDFCSRWGGEEFLVVISNGSNSIEDAHATMERVRKSIESIKWSKQALTVSIGLAAADSNIEKSIGRADEALYLSKTAGRNKVTSYQIDLKKK